MRIFCRKAMASVLAAALLGVGLAGFPAFAKDDPEDLEERYPERLVYDPQAQEWLAEEPPEPGTPDGDLAIARNLIARGEYKQADKALQQWIADYAYESPRHPEAVFLFGRVEFERENFMRAHRRYLEVLNNWPGTEWADRALRGNFVIAEVFLGGHRRKWLGMPLFHAYDEALDILDDIIVNHPNTVLAEQALKTKADYYFRKGEFELAEDAYAQLARDYPAGQYVREAMLQSARAALASFPGVKFDDAALVEAEERFYQFMRVFPQHAAGEDVGLILEDIRAKRAEKEFSIAEYYERAKEPQAAVFYYRLVRDGWPGTTWATLAEARLANLDWAAETAIEADAEAYDATGSVPEPVNSTPYEDDER
ncbi:MAG: outer membrane protein assembly factor BamD [Phycisphaerales bacterium]|nr:MAG: outer membrane protein assembly factor BamD [Phycisphaerales bacterium]